MEFVKFYVADVGWGEERAGREFCTVGGLCGLRCAAEDVEVGLAAEMQVGISRGGCARGGRDTQRPWGWVGGLCRNGFEMESLGGPSLGAALEGVHFGAPVGFGRGCRAETSFAPVGDKENPVAGDGSGDGCSIPVVVRASTPSS